MKRIQSHTPGIVLCLVIVAVAAIDRSEAWYTYVDTVRRDVPPLPPDPNQGEVLEKNETVRSNETDNHDYYDVEYKDQNPEDWMDVDTLGTPLNINTRLSNSDRHAVKVYLNFTFPFYGYDTTFLYVTSSGFLYVGKYSHRLLAETQYVAPLMADFTPNVDNRSIISYYNGNSMFVAEWKNVHLRGQPDENFTFQATIYKNGTLKFCYKELPMTVESLSKMENQTHPVRVGLADAYYHDTSYVIFTRRVIYEYHSVDVPFQNVDPNKTIIFTPRESCTARKTCDSCTTNQPEGFKCVWCNMLQKCSDGFDRHRQAWTNSNCHRVNTTVCSAPTKPTEAMSSTTMSSTTMSSTTTLTPLSPTAMSSTAMSSTTMTSTTTFTPLSPTGEDICPTLDCGPGTCKNNICICPEGYNGRLCQGKEKEEPVPQKKGASHAGLALFMIVLFITIGVIGGWAFYAYRNPTTQSGLTLIRITRCYYCKGAKDSGSSYKYHPTSDNI